MCALFFAVRGYFWEVFSLNHPSLLLIYRYSIYVSQVNLVWRFNGMIALCYCFLDNIWQEVWAFYIIPKFQNRFFITRGACYDLILGNICLQQLLS